MSHCSTVTNFPQSYTIYYTRCSCTILVTLQSKCSSSQQQLKVNMFIITRAHSQHIHRHSTASVNTFIVQQCHSAHPLSQQWLTFNTFIITATALSQHIRCHSNSSQSTCSSSQQRLTVNTFIITATAHNQHICCHSNSSQSTCSSS